MLLRFLKRYLRCPIVWEGLRPGELTSARFLNGLDKTLIFTLAANGSSGKFLFPTIQAELAVIVIGFAAIWTKPYQITFTEIIVTDATGSGEPWRIDGCGSVS
ncbi:MAG TPA: hypothetical protein VKT82_34125 [Ktedonobacterales bacterium]|nr:hypothetical protein [Ktedonobacterales bacterium]